MESVPCGDGCDAEAAAVSVTHFGAAAAGGLDADTGLGHLRAAAACDPVAGTGLGRIAPAAQAPPCSPGTHRSPVSAVASTGAHATELENVRWGSKQIARRLHRQWQPGGDPGPSIAGVRISLASLERCVAAALESCDAPRRAALVMRMLQSGTGRQQLRSASAPWQRYLSAAIDASAVTCSGSYFRELPAKLPALFSAVFTCERVEGTDAPQDSCVTTSSEQSLAGGPLVAQSHSHTGNTPALHGIASSLLPLAPLSQLTYLLFIGNTDNLFAPPQQQLSQSGLPLWNSFPGLCQSHNS
jgi:hypothetical protein